MRTSRILSCAALTLIAAGMATARPEDHLRAWPRSRSAVSNAPEAAGKQSLRYGPDALQVLNFWPAQGTTAPAPLVVFVHGGGWKRGSKDSAGGAWKAPHYTGSGYAYAAINYRLVPAARVEDQAADIAAALRYLIDHVAAPGIAPARIVLMGHSAGAHLAALVGTDERYLKDAGLSLANLSGVITIDGAAYDVPRQIKDGGNFMHDTYEQTFGTAPSRQRALSPTFQAARPNAAAFLLIHVQRKDGIAQNEEFEAALRTAGTLVTRRGFAGDGLRGHREINRSLGDPAYVATPVVDIWLKQQFGR